MDMELELKHLAPYLPYKLRFLEVRKGSFSNSEDIIEQAELHVGNINGLMKGKVYRVKSRQPILRPLSDLNEKDHCVFTSEYNMDIGILIHEPSEINISETQWIVIQKLFEWHFDVFGLIEKGLAIDINTL